MSTMLILLGEAKTRLDAFRKGEVTSKETLSQLALDLDSCPGFELGCDHCAEAFQAGLDLAKVSYRAISDLDRECFKSMIAKKMADAELSEFAEAS